MSSDSDLQRTLGQGLPDDVGKVRHSIGRAPCGDRSRLRSGQLAHANQVRDRLPERGCAADGDVPHTRRLSDARLRHDDLAHVRRSRGGRQRQRTRHGTQASVERELADQSTASSRAQAELT